MGAFFAHSPILLHTSINLNTSETGVSGMFLISIYPEVESLGFWNQNEAEVFISGN